MRHNRHLAVVRPFAFLLMMELSAAANAQAAQASVPVAATSSSLTVACYYFPNFHPGDNRNSADPKKGPAWSEWDLIKAARPRFPGHQQPKVPLWGYQDESDPAVFSQKIDAATSHGIDVFIFDWYHYNDGPFLNKCLDEGFLKAGNRDKLKFALMWANHDWLEFHPYTRGNPQPVINPGKVTPEAFDRICDHVIEDYFSAPNYWKLEGKPYFSFYDLEKLAQSFATVQDCRKSLDRFREKAKAAGLPGLHLNGTVWGRPVLPGDTEPVSNEKIVELLGLDSATTYVWVHHVPLNEPQTEFVKVRDAYFDYWSLADDVFKVPYFPNVSMGWDSSPRANQADEWGNWGYPFTNVIVNNTPAAFRQALQMTRDRLLADPAGPRILTINCWNEWTEGSYLEPDTIHGMQYLEAVRDTVGK